MQSLKSEFTQESPKVINLAIIQKNETINVSGWYEDFVNNFISYSKTKNAKLDIIYILNYDDATTISNHYGETITVNYQTASASLQDGQLLVVGKSSAINITAGEYTYDFEMESGIATKGLLRKGTEIVTY